MDLKATKYRSGDGIAHIELYRPDRHNAWTGRMHSEYRYLIDVAEKDHDVRIVIVTGSGDGFCVGGDMDALEGHVVRGRYDAGTDDEMAKPGFGVHIGFDSDFAYHFGLTNVIIAALNGPVAGVGLAIACYADFRFAAPEVKMTAAHGPLNLPAEFGLSWLLPRMIGIPRASDLLLTSRIFTSEEAERIGLVHSIIPAADLIQHCTDFAADILVRVSPESLRNTKQQLALDWSRHLSSSVIDSRNRLEQMVREPDFAEGVEALKEKRPARWTG